MDLLIYIGKSAAILALFYLVYVAVLRKDTFFTANRHYLLGGILAAISFPFIEFTRTIYMEVPVSVLSNTSNLVPTSQLVVAEQATSFNWWYLVAALYSIGVGLMLLRFFKQLFLLFVLLKKHPSEKRDGYTFIKVPNECPPFSFFKYIVYNPKMHSQEELSMILKHEQVHVSQWHSLDIIAANLMLIFHWVNPIAWFYKKGIEENLEFIADSETVQEVESIKQYQLALVKASSTIPIPALTNNFYQSFIKKRIVMLNKSTSKKINAWKLSIILPVLAVFLWSFNVKEVVNYTEVNSGVNSPASEIASELEPSYNFEMTSASEEDTKKDLAVATKEEVATAFVGTEVTSKAKKADLTSAIGSTEVIVTINKDTSDEELKAMQKELKAKGFKFNYSNVQRNANNEITGISLSYTDANGNSGNYSVNSDEPISSIVIRSEGNSISVSNAGGNNSYSYNTQEDIEHYRVQREKEMEARRGEMEERKVEMEVRRKEMKSRHKEMEERKMELKEQREEMRQERKERLKVIRKKGKNLHRIIDEDDNLIIIEGDDDSIHTIHEDDDGLITIREHNRDSDSNVHRIIRREHHDNDRNHNSLFADDLKKITKNASKAELEKLKSEFKSEGVSFSFSGIKRNSAGEITKIKLKLNNNNGSVSTSTYDNDGEAIKSIYLGVNDGTTIMTSQPH